MKYYSYKNKLGVEMVQILGSPEEFDATHMSKYVERDVERYKNRAGDNRVCVRGPKEEMQDAVKLVKKYTKKMKELKPKTLREWTVFYMEKGVDNLSVEYVLSALRDSAETGERIGRKDLRNLGLSNKNYSELWQVLLLSNMLTLESRISKFGLEELEECLLHVESSK